MLLSLHVYQQNYVTKNTDGVYFVITAYILNYNYIIFSNNNSCMALSLEFYLFSLSPPFEFPYSGKCLFICIRSTGNEVQGSYPSFMHTCTYNLAFSPCFLLKMVLRYICLKLEHRVRHHTITKKRTKKKQIVTLTQNYVKTRDHLKINIYFK